MTEEEQAANQTLMQVVRMVCRANDAHPESEPIKHIFEAVKPMLTPEMCVALFARVDVVESELNRNQMTPMQAMMTQAKAVPR